MGISSGSKTVDDPCSKGGGGSGTDPEGGGKAGSMRRGFQRRTVRSAPPVKQYLPLSDVFEVQ